MRTRAPPAPHPDRLWPLVLHFLNSGPLHLVHRAQHLDARALGDAELLEVGFRKDEQRLEVHLVLDEHRRELVQADAAEEAEELVVPAVLAARRRAVRVGAVGEAQLPRDALHHLDRRGQRRLVCYPQDRWARGRKMVRVPCSRAARTSPAQQGSKGKGELVLEPLSTGEKTLGGLPALLTSRVVGVFRSAESTVYGLILALAPCDNLGGLGAARSGCTNLQRRLPMVRLCR